MTETTPAPEGADDDVEMAVGLALRMLSDDDHTMTITQRLLGVDPYVLITTRKPNEDDAPPDEDVEGMAQVVLDVETGGGVPQDVPTLVQLLETLLEMLRGAHADT